MTPENPTILAYNSDKKEQVYRLAEQTLAPLQGGTPKIKSTLNIGSINDKDLISYSFDVDKGLSEEELADTVEIRMFQDAGLNHMIDYTIVYSCRDSLLDAKSNSVTAFAVAPTQYAGAFGYFRNLCNYIDTILPYSTLPFALYSAEILEPASDIFIYIRGKETTFSVFEAGTFVYAKTITTGLKTLYDAFVKNNNEGVAYDAFIAALLGKQTDAQGYGDDTLLPIRDIADILDKSLADLGNVIQYARRIAGIQNFERVFIGTEEGPVPAFKEMVRSSTGIRTEDFDFFTSFYHETDGYTDQNIILSLIEAENIIQGRKQNPFNLTVYPRPPRLFRRDSGKLLLVTAASLLLSLAYPIYLGVDTYWKSYTYDHTISRLQISQGEFLELKAKEDGLKADKERYAGLLTAQKEALAANMALLQAIEKKKTLKSSKSHTLALLFNEINRHKLQIEKITAEGNRYRIDLQTQKDDYVTALLKSITALKNMDVAMNAFAYNPEIKRFQTQITVEVRG